MSNPTLGDFNHSYTQTQNAIQSIYQSHAAHTSAHRVLIQDVIVYHKEVRSFLISSALMGAGLTSAPELKAICESFIAAITYSNPLNNAYGDIRVWQFLKTYTKGLAVELQRKRLGDTYGK